MALSLFDKKTRMVLKFIFVNVATFLVVKHSDKKSFKNPDSKEEYKMTKVLLLLNFYTVISATCRRKRDFQVVYEKIERQKKIYNSHDRVSIRNSLSANLAEFNSKLMSIEFSKEEKTITGMGFLKVFVNYFLSLIINNLTRFV